MRWRTVQTQLLLRGGPRTPKWRLPQEVYWQATLPEDDLLWRLSRVGRTPDGPRRKWIPRKLDLWGSFTTRGADECFAVGRRLRGRLDESGEVRIDLKDDMESEYQEPIAPETKSAHPIKVFCKEGSRPELTARAVLRGLCLPGQRAIVNTTFSEQLQVQASIDVEEQVLLDDDEMHAWRDAADELSKALKLDGYLLLAGGGWPQLLDAAECASSFGLLPQGELPEWVWRSLYSAPQLAATAIFQDSSKAAEKLGPLLRLVFTECTKAAREATLETPSERIQLVVLPGFSLFCFAQALSLKGSISWPAPSSGLLVETLMDAHGEVFVRFWHPRETWELRPTWYREPGPVPLAMILEVLESSMGGPLPWFADSVASVSVGMTPHSVDVVSSQTS